MPTLVLETSTPTASLLLVHDDGSVSPRSFQSDRSHNAELFRPLQELMAEKPKLELVIAGSGPGSYSGTRVGIAAAQGVAIAMACPAVAISSILGLPGATARALVIGDARRGTCWTAKVAAGSLESPPELCEADELTRIIQHASDEGRAILTMEEPGRFPLANDLLAVIRREVPSASGLWSAWQGAESETRRRWLEEPPQPLYLKPPHITAAKRPWLVEQQGICISKIEPRMDTNSHE
jgi:tRNA threonylcarbamoyl adenosine modification protein YeaZ